VIPVSQGEFQTLSDEGSGYYLTYQTYNWLFFGQFALKNWLKKQQLLTQHLFARITNVSY